VNASEYQNGVDEADTAAAAAAHDALLVRRVRRGDMAACDDLVRRHTRRAYSIAYGVLRHREDAEDVVQESFARALERLDSMDATRPFHPWFYRIVVNAAISARRSRAVRRTEAIPDELAARSPRPDRTAELGALRRRLLDALDELPERQRTIVLLADVEEFSSGEIGEILGMPAGTVRYELHRARGALRERLGVADEEAR